MSLSTERESNFEDISSTFFAPGRWETFNANNSEFQAHSSFLIWKKKSERKKITREFGNHNEEKITNTNGNGCQIVNSLFAYLATLSLACVNFGTTTVFRFGPPRKKATEKLQAVIFPPPFRPKNSHGFFHEK